MTPKQLTYIQQTHANHVRVLPCEGASWGNFMVMWCGIQTGNTAFRCIRPRLPRVPKRFCHSDPPEKYLCATSYQQKEINKCVTVVSLVDGMRNENAGEKRWME